MHRHLLALLLAFTAPPLFAADDPDPPTASDLLIEARELFKQGKREEAIKLTTKAIDINKENIDGYVLRASMLDAMKQYDKAAADYSKVIELEPDAAGAYQRRGECHFKAGKIKESIADFDKYLTFVPQREPDHWQRGLSYYYDGEFDKGVKQFELHKKVNPEDVENAVWHYLCKARIDGAVKAREALIEIKADRRTWAMPVYEMYRGHMTPEEVLGKSTADIKDEKLLKNNLFYAHLYIGLHYESLGKADEAKKHIDIAHEKYPSEHYMGDVARVHYERLKNTPGKRSSDATAPRRNKRIIYIADASGSMIGLFPFILKELGDGVKNLTEVNDFTVIFFQNDNAIEAPAAGLTTASDEEKRKFRNWIADESRPITPQGTSNPIAAFRLAMDYKPDIIYFASDDLTGPGRFEFSQDRVAATIKEINTDKVRIHGVQFFRPGVPRTEENFEPMIKTIAKDSGGGYRFITARELGIPTFRH